MALSVRGGLKVGALSSAIAITTEKTICLYFCWRQDKELYLTSLLQSRFCITLNDLLSPCTLRFVLLQSDCTHVKFSSLQNTKRKMTIRLISLSVLVCILETTSSQYNIDNPSPTQCLAAPCDYVGDCRSANVECGEGADYCNESSLWVPACGGGGTLQKETTTTATSKATVQTEDTSSETNLDKVTDASNNYEPTSAPTTAWDAWINGKTNEADGESNGVIGYTTGKEGEENWTPTNDTGWFDKEGWDSGNRTEEDGSLLSKYNPFSRGDEDKNIGTRALGGHVWGSAGCSMVAFLTMFYVLDSSL